jgi:hypothetical protein
MALVATGIAFAVPLLVTYFSNDLLLERADTLENHLAVTGLAAAITGAQLFVSTLVLHGTVLATGRNPSSTSLGGR